MSFFSSCRGGIGEIEYDAEAEERIELSSIFLNEKKYLPILKLLVEMKKQKLKHMIRQRNCVEFTESAPVSEKINNGIVLVFHYFASLEKSASNLFCMGDIENIDQAIDVYKNYIKKIPLEWSICTSTNILRTLPKLKTNLEKLLKKSNINILSAYKILRRKNSSEEENIRLLIKNTKRELKSLLNPKQFR